MQVNDSRAWTEQMVLASRRKDWEFSEHPGYVEALCRNCVPLCFSTRAEIPSTSARKEALFQLDRHQVEMHDACSGDLHTTPHRGCILR